MNIYNDAPTAHRLLVTPSMTWQDPGKGISVNILNRCINKRKYRFNQTFLKLQRLMFWIVFFNKLQHSLLKHWYWKKKSLSFFFFRSKLYQLNQLYQKNYFIYFYLFRLIFLSNQLIPTIYLFTEWLWLVQEYVSQMVHTPWRISMLCFFNNISVNLYCIPHV